MPGTVIFSESNFVYIYTKEYTYILHKDDDELGIATGWLIWTICVTPSLKLRVNLDHCLECKHMMMMMMKKKTEIVLQYFFLFFFLRQLSTCVVIIKAQALPSGIFSGWWYTNLEDAGNENKAAKEEIDVCKKRVERNIIMREKKMEKWMKYMLII